MAVTIDLLIAIILGVALYRGWRRGAAAMLVRTAVIIIAILIADIVGAPLGKMIGIGFQSLQPIIGFFVSFIVLSVIGRFATRSIVPTKGMFAGLNSILGGAFGFIRALLVIGLTIAFFRMFQLPSKDDVKDNLLYPFVLKTTAIIAGELRPLVSQFNQSDMFEDILPIDSTSSPQ